MNSWDFFSAYQPLNLHFTTSYDAIKYGGKTKSVSHSAFSTRKDKSLYEGWAKEVGSREDAGRLCIANFVYNIEGWLYQEKVSAHDAYNKWKKIRQNIDGTVKEEAKYVLDLREGKGMSWEYMTHPTPSGKKPPLLQISQAGHISKEFLCILDLNFNFLDTWHTIYEQDPYTSSWIFKVQKYRPFCKGFVSRFKTQMEELSKENG